MQVIPKALGAIVFVEVVLLTATAVTVRLVTVLREERTLPATVAELVHGAVIETLLATSQVTVPLVTVMVARTPAVMLVVSVPVDAACATHGTIRAANKAAADTAVFRFTFNCMGVAFHTTHHPNQELRV
jgi:fatty acid desaturase